MDCEMKMGGRDGGGGGGGGVVRRRVRVHLRASASSWRSFSDCASRVQTQSMDAGEREGGRDANKFITLNLRFHK